MSFDMDVDAIGAPDPTTPFDLMSADPARLAAALGFASASLVSALLATPPLRPLIAARIDALLAEAAAPPVADEASDPVAAFLRGATFAEIEAAARVATALAHAPTLLATTDGAVLALALTFAGRRGLADALRAGDAPMLTTPPAPETLTPEGLSALAARPFARLMAQTPPARRLRFDLAAPAENLFAIDAGEGPIEPADEAVWRALIARAVEIVIAEREDAHAPH